MKIKIQSPGGKAMKRRSLERQSNEQGQELQLSGMTLKIALVFLSVWFVVVFVNAGN